MATKKKAPKKARAAQAVLSREVPAPSSDITITISGPAEHVRLVINEMHFDPPVSEAGSNGLSIGEGRRIAREQTLTLGVQSTDSLGAPPIDFVSQGLRDAYKDRCLKAAEDAGHPITNESKIPNKSDTKVFEVGDALSEFSS